MCPAVVPAVALPGSAVLLWCHLQEEIPPNEAQEHSELLAYKALVLQEGGQLQEALNLLEQSKV